MKPTLSNLVAAVALSVASLAHAGPQANADPQAAAPAAPAAAEALAPIESVTVTARRFHMEPQEFMDYEYAYNLSNGEVVRFSRRVGRFYVAIKGQPTVEIFPTAADQFVTKGGARLLFTEGGDALNIDHNELLELASGLPIASAPAAK